MKTIFSILLCLTLLSAASTQAAEGQNLLPPSSDFDFDQSNERAAERSVERAPRISETQASDIARDNVPGSRVLNIRRDNQNWRVRVDQEGRMSDVLVNAESGNVSRENGN